MTKRLRVNTNDGNDEENMCMIKMIGNKDISTWLIKLADDAIASHHRTCPRKKMKQSFPSEFTAKDAGNDAANVLLSFSQKSNDKYAISPVESSSKSKSNIGISPILEISNSSPVLIPFEEGDLKVKPCLSLMGPTSVWGSPTTTKEILAADKATSEPSSRKEHTSDKPYKSFEFDCGNMDQNWKTESKPLPLPPKLPNELLTRHV